MAGMGRAQRGFQYTCLLLTALMLGLGVMSLGRLQLNNDILALFPGLDEHSAEAEANRLRAGSIEREILLLVYSSDQSRLHDTLPAVVENLKRCDCFAEVAARLADLGGGQSFDLPGAHPSLLLTPQWRRRLASLTPGQLTDQALQRLLMRPGGFSSAELRTDPLGSLADFKQQWQPEAGRISANDAGYAQLTLPEGDYILLRLTLSGSPFRLSLQRSAEQALAQALAPVRALPEADVLYTGAFFYTLAGTEQARAEISTVGLGSALGIIALFVLVFRSPGLLLLAFVPIGVGVLTGLAVVQWWFGQVHIIALVFGSALVGVAIDYTLHFYAKRLDAGQHWNLADGYRRLIAPLSLGLLTSVAGYLSFTATGFPGFTQVAVMSCAGLIAAFVTVMGLYPVLLARPGKRNLSRPLLILLNRGVRGQQAIVRLSRRPLLWLLLAGAALAIGPLWQSNDDIRQMQNPPARLQSMDEIFRSALGARRAMQYILVEASDEAGLLSHLQQIEKDLSAAQSAGQLAGFDLLSRWLPSERQQRENRALWQARVIDSGVLADLLNRLGVRDAAASSIVADMRTSQVIEPQEVFGQLRGAAMPLVFQHRGKFYSVVSLNGPLDAQALSALADRWPYAEWVDPVARTNQLLQHYRHNASALLVLAYGLIGLLLCGRYGPGGALRVILPPAMASVVTLFGLLALGQAISVFHIMALMLVLGIGIDYTLFVRESADLSRSTLLAIGLSTVTTVLSFGLLALSGTQAIAHFGVAVFWGMILAFVLAPLAQRQ